MTVGNYGFPHEVDVFCPVAGGKHIGRFVMEFSHTHNAIAKVTKRCPLYERMLSELILQEYTSSPLAV